MDLSIYLRDPSFKPQGQSSMDVHLGSGVTLEMFRPPYIIVEVKLVVVPLICMQNEDGLKKINC